MINSLQIELFKSSGEIVVISEYISVFSSIVLPYYALMLIKSITQILFTRTHLNVSVYDYSIRTTLSE